VIHFVPGRLESSRRFSGLRSRCVTSTWQQFAAPGANKKRTNEELREAPCTGDSIQLPKESVGRIFSPCNMEDWLIHSELLPAFKGPCIPNHVCKRPASQNLRRLGTLLHPPVVELVNNVIKELSIGCIFHDLT